jgi:hypothetical protein
MLWLGGRSLANLFQDIHCRLPIADFGFLKCGAKAAALVLQQVACNTKALTRQRTPKYC